MSDDAVYQCPFCPDRFVSISAFDRHIATAHPDPEPEGAATEAKDREERGGCFGFFMLLFFLGILSLILGTVNQIFGLGIWHNDYPGLGTKSDGSVGTVPVGYGKFMWEFALMTLAYGLIAVVIAAVTSDD